METVDKEAAVESLTDVLAKFTAYIGKRLPKDVKEKTAKLRAAKPTRWPSPSTTRWPTTRITLTS